MVCSRTIRSLRFRQFAGRRKPAKQARRECRIRSGHFSQLVTALVFLAETLRKTRFRHFRSFAVACGCFGLFGVVFSTLSAHRDAPPAATRLFSVPVIACGRRSRRRSRREGEDDARRRKIAASYARFSDDDLQNPNSIGQQQRPCRERAKRDDNRLPTELEFFDEGVSGAKLRRDGFDRMLAAAKEGLFGTLYIFDLSRLARECIINATTLKKLVYKYRIRVVSLTEGVDSNNQGWFTLATILGLQHEQFLKTLGANVMRGLIGNLLDGLSVGDLAYGYGSVPVPGSEERRRGSNLRPQMKYVIKEHEAQWVRKIFHWFVNERQAIQWIVRELNRLKAPRNKRSRDKKWGRAAVINALRRTKYIGLWEWGLNQNQRDPETGEIYQEPREEEEWKKWVRHLPELKIVKEEIFAEAQRLLDENEAKCAEFRGKEGTFTGSAKDQANPRHLLQRRIRCSECGSVFYVAGAAGKYLACPGARDGVCTCRTMLPRKSAEKQILGEIGRRILEDPEWRKTIHDGAFRAWQKFQAEVPSELQTAQEQLYEIDRRISNLVDQIEEGNAVPDVRHRLDVRREEKDRLVRHVGALQRRAKQAPQTLTPEQIDEALTNLHGVLSGGTPAAAIALGNLIGDVIVRQVSRPGRKRPYLRGEFVLRTQAVVNGMNRTPGWQSSSDSPEAPGEKIMIDFVEPDPKYEMSDKVKELSGNNLANWEIAEQLNLHPSRVTLLFNLWFERRGLPIPLRNNRLKRKKRETPLYQKIADFAKQRWEAGDSESAIGRDFKTTQATVQNAITWWHESRNLPVPRFKDRRQMQVELAGNMGQAGCTMAEIAGKMKRSVNTVRKLLNEWHATKGQVRPDGRTERRLRKKSA
jgi:site-specific DNA recombinase